MTRIFTTSIVKILTPQKDNGKIRPKLNIYGIILLSKKNKKEMQMCDFRLRITKKPSLLNKNRLLAEKFIKFESKFIFDIYSLGIIT